MRVQRLRVNHLRNPRGFNLRKPVFSWCVEGSMGTKAEASRIRVLCVAPGTNAYDQWLQVQTYDVTETLAQAAEKTELSFAMGNGWWKGRFGFIPEDRGFYGNDWRLIAEMHVIYADGTEEVFSTGEGWQLPRASAAVPSTDGVIL